MFDEWYNPDKHGPVPDDLKAVITETQQQPIPDDEYRCTIMFPENGRSWARWAKIPCHYPLALSAFICKQPAISADQEINYRTNISRKHRKCLKSCASSFIDNNSKLITQPILCPLGWTYWNDMCVSMFSQSELPNMLTWLNASLTCESKGATVFSLNNNKHWKQSLISLLKRWKHYPQYGPIWILSNATTLSSSYNHLQQSCGMLEVYMEKEGDTKLLMKKGPCFLFDIPTKYGSSDKVYKYPKGTLQVSPIKPKPWNVLCQKNVSKPVRQTCKPFQFKCADRLCISIDSVCDGAFDCRNGEDELNCSCGFDYYKCNNRCISLSKYCDHKKDCKDGSDEENCIFPECSKSEYKCENKECIPIFKRCDFVEDCLDGTDESGCDWDAECIQGRNDSLLDVSPLYRTLGLGTIAVGKGMMCFSGKCLPASKFRDLRADCSGPSAEDEVLTVGESIPGSIKSKTFDPNGAGGVGALRNHISYCESFDSVRCLPAHTKCFKRHHACIYDHNQFGDVASCRNLEHLKDCRDHECPGMVKCPNSYCIPHRKMCDGVWDCIGGFDESNCNNYTCPGLFRCKGETRCLDQYEICDGVVQCPDSREDEKYCHYDKSPCPNNCTCLGNVINCSMSRYIQLPLISNQTRSLDISYNMLDITPRLFSELCFLVRLNVSHNGISKLIFGSFAYLHNLLELDLSHNKIIHLVNGTFIHLGNVRHLYLNGNQITSISSGSFVGLSKLQELNLSYQNLVSLETDTFVGLLSLQTLDLSLNSLIQIKENSFRGLSFLSVLHIYGNQLRIVAKNSLLFENVDDLRTDAYKFCCLSNSTICSPEGDEFSSCDDLLANGALQLSIWVLGAMALLGNFFVIILRCVRKDHAHYAIKLIINLGISDFLMGVYLIIIASVDQWYRGVYILFEDEWRKSFLCRFAGMIAVLSSEMSVFTMVVMTLDRVNAIINPFKYSSLKLTSKTSLMVCFSGWVVFLVISIVPMFDGSYFQSFYGKNGVCLPFTLKNINNPGWEYAMFIFILMNGIAFIVILVGYFMIYCSTQSSRQASGRSFADSDLRLLKKITLIIISDCLCWMPIMILSCMALSGVFIPAVVSAWVAVFVLPLNSALNPFLYTISTIKSTKNEKSSTS